MLTQFLDSIEWHCLASVPRIGSTLMRLTLAPLKGWSNIQNDFVCVLLVQQLFHSFRDHIC